MRGFDEIDGSVGVGVGAGVAAAAEGVVRDANAGVAMMTMVVFALRQLQRHTFSNNLRYATSISTLII
jgi:hypothetical protein